jgi:hypothetical protein
MFSWKVADYNWLEGRGWITTSAANSVENNAYVCVTLWCHFMKLYKEGGWMDYGLLFTYIPMNEWNAFKVLNGIWLILQCMIALVSLVYGPCHMSSHGVPRCATKQNKTKQNIVYKWKHVLDWTTYLVRCIHSFIGTYLSVLFYHHPLTAFSQSIQYNADCRL